MTRMCRGGGGGGSCSLQAGLGFRGLGFRPSEKNLPTLTYFSVLYGNFVAAARCSPMLAETLLGSECPAYAP